MDTKPTQSDSAAEDFQNNVKIKLERIDPEIELKINAIADRIIEEATKHEPKDTSTGNGGTEDSGDDSSSHSTEPDGEEEDEEVEDKKAIEPVKSSNEILTELFMVFNAAPPEEILDDKSLLKKRSHKPKKVKKEKKKKSKRSKSQEKQSASDSGDSLEGSAGRHKHKKKKKHKHKDDKDKDKDKSKEKSKEKRKSKEKSKEREKEKSKDLKNESTTISLRVKEELLTTADHSVDSSRQRNSRKRHTDEDAASTDRHAKSSRRERSSHRDNEGNNDFYNGFRDHEKRRDTTRGDDRPRERERERPREVKIKTEPSDTHHSGGRHRNDHGRTDDHISEISLSDEETYLKERERTRDTGRRRSGHDSTYSSSRAHNSFYAGASAPRSRSRSRSRERDRNRDSRYRGSGSSRRQRSRSRTHDLGIDKKRLLEIARKNAISMFKRGNLPGCSGLTEEIKDKVLLKMRYGGRTVQDLTDFCKKISNGENLADLSSDEDSDVDKSGNAKAFHHPFLINEREPIVMHIRNATAIPPRGLPAPKSDDQTKAITMQFPVSSGQQHRMTEVWVPVESKNALVPLPALPAATQATNIFKGTTSAKEPEAVPPPAVSKIVEKNVFNKAIPSEQQQEHAFTPVGVPSPVPPPVPDSAPAPTTNTKEISLDLVPLPVAAPPLFPAVAVAVKTGNGTAASEPSAPFVPDVPIPSAAEPAVSVFPRSSSANFDVSNIISKRLNAMRRLQDNPMDSEAIKMMYNSQREMSSWASSKHLPGQFTGSTGVNVLRARELNSGPQLWARRDQLTNTQPVTGGMGMQLLQKMGWKPGEGLGREKSGSLQPLLLDVKLDKRGLVTEADNNGYRRPSQTKKARADKEAQAQQLTLDKHPVCLLNELTSKRKWTPPLYTLVNEVGPSHSKMFMFSVSINGKTFTPNQASNTKKEAKLLTARFCLQQMGILP